LLLVNQNELKIYRPLQKAAINETQLKLSLIEALEKCSFKSKFQSYQQILSDLRNFHKKLKKFKPTFFARKVGKVIFN
jgi:hypothetical protein